MDKFEKIVGYESDSDEVNAEREKEIKAFKRKMDRRKRDDFKPPVDKSFDHLVKSNRLTGKAKDKRNKQAKQRQGWF